MTKFTFYIRLNFGEPIPELGKALFTLGFVLRGAEPFEYEFCRYRIETFDTFEWIVGISRFSLNIIILFKLFLTILFLLTLTWGANLSWKLHYLSNRVVVPLRRKTRSKSTKKKPTTVDLLEWNEWLASLYTISAH